MFAEFFFISTIYPPSFLFALEIELPFCVFPGYTSPSVTNLGYILLYIQYSTHDGNGIEAHQCSTSYICIIVHLLYMQPAQSSILQFTILELTHRVKPRCTLHFTDILWQTCLPVVITVCLQCKHWVEVGDKFMHKLCSSCAPFQSIPCLCFLIWQSRWLA